MSDKPEVQYQSISKDPPKPEKEVVHVGMTEEEVEAKITKLRDEYHELHSSDKAEREELKAEMAELKEYRAGQEKLNEERDKVKGSESTLVLPPNDIPVQQPNPSPKPEDSGDGKKRSRWKGAW